MTEFLKSDDYFYDENKVLKNKLDIHDKNLLFESERKLSALRISELMNSPIQGSFDFNHLKKIHLYIFQDLYEWAGEIRKSELAKKDLFCLYDKIELFAKEIFDNLKNDNYFIDYDDETKISKLVELFADINALHPFREGNGRSQREFIEELAKINGFNLDLTKIDQENMIEASHRSMNGDNSLLESLFKKNINIISKQLQIYYIYNICEPRLAKQIFDKIFKGKVR